MLIPVRLDIHSCSLLASTPDSGVPVTDGYAATSMIETANANKK
jgi:hypothetical protein